MEKKLLKLRSIAELRAFYGISLFFKHIPLKYINFINTHTVVMNSFLLLVWTSSPVLKLESENEVWEGSGVGGGGGGGVYFVLLFFHTKNNKLILFIVKI